MKIQMENTVLRFLIKSINTHYRWFNRNAEEALIELLVNNNHCLYLIKKELVLYTSQLNISDCGALEDISMNYISFDLREKRLLSFLIYLDIYRSVLMDVLLKGDSDIYRLIKCELDSSLVLDSLIEINKDIDEFKLLEDNNVSDYMNSISYDLDHDYSKYRIRKYWIQYLEMELRILDENSHSDYLNNNINSCNN